MTDNSLSKKVELLANVSIILLAAVLMSVLAGRYLFGPRAAPPATAEAPAQIKPGTALSVPGLDWGKGERTLLMVLSTGCRFCTESTPFYRRIAEGKLRRGGTRLVALLPEDVAASEKYLGEHGVVVDEVRQAPPTSVQVRGTPTLILADRTGAVIASWVGRLPPEKEAEVLSLL